MFNFELKKAAIFQAIRWAKHPIFRFAGTLKKLFLILFILTFGLFLYFLIFERFTSSKLEGLALIFLVFTLISRLVESFFNSKLKKPRLKAEIQQALVKPEEFNLAEFLSFEVAKAVAKVVRFAGAKKISVDSSLLFFFLLLDNPKLNFIFSRALLSLKEIKKILESHFKITKSQVVGVRPQQIYSEEFQNAILESLKIAQKKNHQRIEIGDALCALAKYDLVFKKILIDSELKIEDIENLTWWLENLEKKIEERRRWWEWKNLIKNGSLAKDWTAGYTPTLDRFSIDISELVRRQGFPEIIGHEKTIQAIERILAKREACNDPLIVGEAGTGRKSIIYALAVKSVLGESLLEVNYKRIVQLNLQSLLSQFETLEERESILDAIFREVMSAGNIILVIDNFHNFVGAGKIARPGTIDISGILSAYISSPYFQLIGITTYEGFHRNIEPNPGLADFFEKVEVEEISRRETLLLLENLALRLERKHKKFVAYLALRGIIDYCDKYLPANSFPEKALDLLEEAMVWLAQQKEKILLPKHVAKVFSEKIQIPVGEMETKEKEILLKLEELIHQRIINQEEAVKEVSAALRRARVELSARNKPMGSFLFLGPTGVGKTETSKALAELYFGSEKRMLRLDMSEFQQAKDIPRIIGSAGEEGLLTTLVRENPFALILLDEIEKAHPNILNLFLQILDEGFVTDGLGRKVIFRETIIIATSNAGYQIILKAIEEKTDWSRVKEKLLNFLFEKGIFRPEFINRFDAVVIFRPLDKNNLLNIAELMLQKIKKGLKEKEIEFVITEPLKEKIVELSYDPKFGAREMKRVIQDRVENILASALLNGELKRENRVSINPENFDLKIE